MDLDGVLANQIHGVLPIVNATHHLDLTYADITDWRLPVGDSDIAVEIVRALESEQYVRSMPMHEGAKEMLDCIARFAVVEIVTARAGEAIPWSTAWLHRHELTFDAIVGASEARKSVHGTDALVDDYPGNIAEFVTNTPGVGVCRSALERRSVVSRSLDGGGTGCRGARPYRSLRPCARAPCHPGEPTRRPIRLAAPSSLLAPLLKHPRCCEPLTKADYGERTSPFPRSPKPPAVSKTAHCAACLRRELSTDKDDQPREIASKNVLRDRHLSPSPADEVARQVRRRLDSRPELPADLVPAVDEPESVARRHLTQRR